MITRILIVAVIGLMSQTSRGNAIGNDFIVGPGEQLAPVGRYPSFVAITTTDNVECGGFIINSNHIITTGSCVLDGNHHLIAPSSVSIYFGFTTLPGNHDPLVVERIYIHPLYNPFTFDNDIAVLRTVDSIPIEGIRNSTVFPAEINNRILPSGTTCEFVGLKNFSVYFIPQPVEFCTLWTSLKNGVVPSQFCAGDTLPGPCLSNRGGPLFCGNTVTGILSNGFSCGTEQKPGVYTHLRLYIPWIMQQFLRNDLTPAGATPPPTFPLLGGQSTVLGCMSLIALSIFGLILAG